MNLGKMVRPRMSLGEMAVGARFVISVPGFLRRPIAVAHARERLRQNHARRGENFLSLVRGAVFTRPESPYLRLFRHIGCEYGDLERLVRREGLDGALGILFRRGIYLTLDELKGRRPVVRGSARVEVNPARLRNPGSTAHFLAQTSGSRGAPASLAIDLDAIRELAETRSLVLDACGGSQWKHALWGVPGSWAIDHLIQYSLLRTPPDRWFSQVDPAAAGLHPRYRWSARALRTAGALAGVRLPRPEYVPQDNPLPVAGWIADVLGAGSTPHLETFPSSATRLCQAAFEAGLDLSGAQFWLSSEPLTAPRLAVIRRVGAKALGSYGSAECGMLGFGCLAPEGPDDLHLFTDRHAVVQVAKGEEVEGLPVDALLFSSLSHRCRLVLINVSMSDVAKLTRRECGCPLERLGWTTYLHTIRSFEKVNTGGMTFLDHQIIRVLEDVLPGRFGGGPTDYQLVEEESESGEPRLRLLVHPSVGPLDEGAVVESFLATIGSGDGTERVFELQWRQLDMVRVERRAPLATSSGKILHLHQGQERHYQH